MTKNNPPIGQVIHGYQKTIKLYSDNPIHDAIDKIIESCHFIDEGRDTYYHSIELRNAASLLLSLSVQNIAKQNQELNG